MSDGGCESHTMTEVEWKTVPDFFFFNFIIMIFIIEKNSTIAINEAIVKLQMLHLGSLIYFYDA